MFPPSEQRKIVSGLQVAIFLGAIDQTLISVALLSIARDLGGVSLIAWVVAAYTVAATVATPVYGGLSDIYGRKRMMTIAIALYAVAAFGCMLAQTMTQLLLLRVLQGVGGGGLLVLAQSTIGDVVPPAERGRYQAWLSGTYALAALLGPIAGGYLTAWFGWRYVFVASVPLAVIALLLTRRILGRLPQPARPSGLDYLSVLLLAAGLTGPLIALTRIGQGIALSDPLGVALVAGGIVLLWWFWRRQFQTRAPIMSPEVLRNPIVCWSGLAGSLLYFAMIGGAVMLPLAFQILAKDTTDQVALKMLLFAMAIPVGAFISGRIMVRTMRLRRNMIGGPIVAAIGAAALALLSFDATIAIGLATVLLGFGIGMALPPGMVSAQTAVAMNRIGAATAFMGLSRSFGSALGLAVLPSVLFSAAHVVSGTSGGAAALLLTATSAVDPGLVQGFAPMFLCMAAALILSTLSAMRLPPQAPSQRPPSSAVTGASER